MFGRIGQPLNDLGTGDLSDTHSIRRQFLKVLGILKL